MEDNKLYKILLLNETYLSVYISEECVLVETQLNED